jgi:hypothetical protein
MTMEREFGKALDEALGDGPPEVARRVQRANVLEAMHRVDRPLERVRWELAAGLLAVVIAASAVFAWRGRDETASASLRGGAQLAASSTVTSGEHAETIDFSDGSRVLLEPRAAARVVRLDRQHTELALKSGKLEASVRHREGASWTVVAGPYEVHVVGTKFTVDWQQANNAFRVAVTEGRVRVTGGELGERVVYLEPGQQWEQAGSPPAPAAPPAPPVAASPAPAETETVTELELEPAPPSAVSPQTLAPRSPRAAASVPPPDRAPTIAELTKSGKYRDALELAEEQGFERVITELPEGELLGLGNAARYTGQRGRARQAMLAVRDRFSGRPAAGLAALYLARIAEQLDHNPKEAARWLRVFLAGSPTGSLAADARASLLSILLAAGDTPGATAVARDYLRFHPTGPVADRARALVSRADSK